MEADQHFSIQSLDKYTGGDPDLTIQLIEIFLKQVPEAIEKLEAAIPEGDWKNVHAIAHKVKSSVAIFDLNDLKKLLINTNLVTILGRISPSLFLTKAIYFDKSPEANWYVTWHQDIVINVKEKIETEGFSGWTKKSGVYGVCPPG